MTTNETEFNGTYQEDDECPCCGNVHLPSEGCVENYRGWPGDGSGEDDLSDFNANEADDYRDEGESDSYCDFDTPLGDEYGGE